VLTPALAEFTSKRAFELLYDHIEALERDYEIGIRDRGVVINRIDVRKRQAQDMIEWIHNAFDNVPVWEVRERASIQYALEEGVSYCSTNQMATWPKCSARSRLTSTRSSEVRPMADDRSERLRWRRQEVRERDEPGERDKPSEMSKPSKLSEPDETDKPSGGEEGSVKEEQVGTYMYLRPSRKRELDKLYKLLSAEYEYEFDEDFEKNRHFYLWVIEHGIAELDELGADEIREYLDELPKS
jgi:hypothetical protein